MKNKTLRTNAMKLKKVIAASLAISVPAGKPAFR